MNLLLPLKWIVPALLVLSIAGCGDSDGEEARVPAATGEAGAGRVEDAGGGTLKREVQRPVEPPAPVRESTTYPTVLAARSQVTILSRVAGLIISVSGEEGRWVEKGAELARIDPQPYRLALQKAGAEAKRMRFTYLRKSQLRGQGISENEVEIAEAEYRKAQADSALRDLEFQYTRIRTPMSGYVTERRIREGAWVGALEPLFTVVDPARLWAVALVPAPLLEGMEIGDPVRVRILDREPALVVEGRLHLRNPVADPGSGRIKITVEILNERGRLTPGMPAELLIPGP